MIARYDLKYELITFDFYSWLVIAATNGATEIVFGTREYRKTDWSDDVLRKRFETMIAPGPALMGLPSREGDDGVPVWPLALRYFHFVKWVRENKNFTRLKSVLPPGKSRYTVTLRKQVHKSHLNSNEGVWREFAAEIGALVIEDYDDRPIDLHERVALYAGAEMNFGTACGPLFLCALTDYPCMVFNFGANRDFQMRSGIVPPEPMPWNGKNHFTIWERDDPGTIRRYFEAWRRK